MTDPAVERIDERALSAACDAIAEAAGVERSSIDEAVARAAVTAYLLALSPPEGEAPLVSHETPNGETQGVLCSTGGPQVAPAGWKLVPVEPTEEMLDAVYTELGIPSEGWHGFEEAYAAMLAASPVPPLGGVGE